MQLYPTPAPPLSLKPRRKYLWTVWENPYSNPIVINKDWDDFIKKLEIYKLAWKNDFIFYILCYFTTLCFLSTLPDIYLMIPTKIFIRKWDETFF